MTLRTVKFTNGNILTIEDEAGYRLYKLTKANIPLVYVENGCYKFARNLVYRYPLPAVDTLTKVITKNLHTS